MKGSYHITAYNSKVYYDITIRRNITVICGNSGSGKTTLVNLIRNFEENGKASGVTINCEVDCIVVSGKKWYEDITAAHNTIIFIDEAQRFVHSHEFAMAVRGSDNYFVIISRDPLYQLPYSVNEIYEIVVNKHKSGIKQTYNQLERVYVNDPPEKCVKVDGVITEDSGAGYEFFKMLCDEKSKNCRSAQGKGNVRKEIGLKDDSKNHMLVVADGAAFGSEMQAVIKRIEKNNNYVLYLPESFEWMILKAQVFSDSELVNVLNEPAEFVDSVRYESWEQFFTGLLKEATSRYGEKIGKKLTYSKENLSAFFRKPEIVSKVRDYLSDFEI